MSSYTYSTYNRNTSKSIYDQIVALGDDNPVLTMNGHLEITTTLSKSVVDDIVTNSLKGTLEDAKVSKINEIKGKSGALYLQGTSHLDGVLDMSYEMRGRLRDLADDVSDGFLSLPQVLNTSYGTINFTTLASIKDGAQALIVRALYIDDGQVALIASVNAATTISQVNAITDTRS